MAFSHMPASVDFLTIHHGSRTLQPIHILPCVLLVVLAVCFSAARRDSRPDLPLLNPLKWYHVKFARQLMFLFNGIEELAKARRLSKGGPFRLLTNTREIVVLPPSYVEPLVAENKLSFAKYFADEFDGEGRTPGLEPYTLIADPCRRVPGLVKKRLTRSLNTLPLQMSSEATFAINNNYGNNFDWQEATIHHRNMDVIARLISRLFWDGNEMCRNNDWLKIMKEWSINSVIAAYMISMAPAFLRPLIRRLSSRVRRAQHDYQAARDFIEPLIHARRSKRDEARAQGQPVPTFNDVVDWIDSENEKVACDPVALQMVLNVAAVHTTAALVTNTLDFLANDPSTLAPLREELVAELKADGCQAGALSNLKLMDSALKECLRLKPPGVFGMHREALEDVQLPGGLNIRKGDRVFVDIPHMRDANVYEAPDRFDMYRFYRMRSSTDDANKAPLVNTSPDHLAFGHGVQACPGRFFAAVLSKVVLSHLLLKYDWRMAPASNSESLAVGLTKRINPRLKLVFRRRKEEFHLS